MTIEIPLQLQHHSFPNISIIANPDYQASTGPTQVPAIDAKLTVGEIDGSHNHFVIELRVQLNAANNPRLPYSLDIVCAMQTIVTEPLPTEKPMSHLMAETGHRLLFPAIRELVLSLTARQPWGQFSIGIGTLGAVKQTAQPKPGQRKAKAPPAKHLPPRRRSPP